MAMMKNVAALLRQHHTEAPPSLAFLLASAKDEFRAGVGAASKVIACDELAAALQANVNPSLTALDLSGSALSGRGLATVAAALGARGSTPLRKLTLVRCQLDASDVAALCKALLNSKTLTELDVSENGLGGDGADAVAGLLKATRTLITLSLRDCAIGDRGCTALAGALAASSTTLRRLNVSVNQIGDTGVAELAAALKKNSVAPARALEIASGAVSGDEAQALSRSLVALALRDNSIGARGGAALRAMLEANSTLHELDVRGNRGLGNEGVAAIAAALNTNVALSLLDVGACAVGDVGVCALATALCSNRALVTLRLPGNSAWLATASDALARALTDNDTLQELVLASNDAPPAESPGAARTPPESSTIRAGTGTNEVAEQVARLGSSAVRRLARALDSNDALVVYSGAGEPLLALEQRRVNRQAYLASIAPPPPLPQPQRSDQPPRHRTDQSYDAGGALPSTAFSSSSSSASFALPPAPSSSSLSSSSSASLSHRAATASAAPTELELLRAEVEKAKLKIELRKLNAQLDIGDVAKLQNELRLLNAQLDAPAASVAAGNPGGSSSSSSSGGVGGISNGGGSFSGINANSNASATLPPPPMLPSPTPQPVVPSMQPAPTPQPYYIAPPLSSFYMSSYNATMAALSSASSLASAAAPLPPTAAPYMLPPAVLPAYAASLPISSAPATYAAPSFSDLYYPNARPLAAPAPAGAYAAPPGSYTVPSLSSFYPTLAASPFTAGSSTLTAPSDPLRFYGGGARF